MNTLSNVIDAIKDQTKQSDDNFKTLGDLVSEGHKILKSVGDSMSFAMTGIKNPSKRKTFGASPRGSDGSMTKGLALEKAREDKMWKEELLDAIKALGAGGGIGGSTMVGSSSKKMPKVGKQAFDWKSILSAVGISGALVGKLGPVLKRFGWAGLIVGLVLDGWDVAKAALDGDVKTEVDNQKLSNIVVAGLAGVLGTIFLGPAGGLFGALVVPRLMEWLKSTFNPSLQQSEKNAADQLNLEDEILQNKRNAITHLEQIGKITKEQADEERKKLTLEQKRLDALRNQAKEFKAANDKKIETLKKEKEDLLKTKESIETINPNDPALVEIEKKLKQNQSELKYVKATGTVFNANIQDLAEGAEKDKFLGMNIDSSFEDKMEEFGVFKNASIFDVMMSKQRTGNIAGKIDKNKLKYLTIEDLQMLKRVDDVSDADKKLIDEVIKQKQENPQLAKQYESQFLEIQTMRKLMKGNALDQQALMNKYSDNMYGKDDFKKMIKLNTLYNTGDFEALSEIINRDRMGITVNNNVAPVNNNNSVVMPNAPVKQSTSTDPADNL